MGRPLKRSVVVLVVFTVIVGLLGIFVSGYRYDSIETKTHIYETVLSENITLTRVVTTQSVSFLYETLKSIQTTTLFQRSIMERVGDEVVGWGYGLGHLQPGDMVIAEVSSVHKVLLCLDKPPKAEYGLVPRYFYYDCEYAYITDQGRYEMEIVREGFYTLVVGKQAGYIVTSFVLKLTFIRQQEAPLILTQTTTVAFTTTHTIETITSYRTTIITTYVYTTKRGMLG